jgi:competence ComEA-like helix-hairpin-helix protein
MSDAETRGLGRVAVILLAASLARLAWGSVSPGEPTAAPDVLPLLLAESRERADEARRREAPLGVGERLDPNRANAAELDRLPGVGPSTAEALVRSREAEGPFRVPEDLLRVRGIGPSLLARIRPHLDLDDPPRGRRHAAGPAPGPALVDLNRADTLALRDLPGVGPALARRILEARSRGPFRTVDDLLRVRGIGPATLARLRPLVTVTR